MLNSRDPVLKSCFASFSLLPMVDLYSRGSLSLYPSLLLAPCHLRAKLFSLITELKNILYQYISLYVITQLYIMIYIYIYMYKNKMI